MDAPQAPKSLAPGMLIAVPQLLDPNFRQSVILLLQQGEEGAVGLVINRESTLSLRELCRDHKISYEGDPGKKVRVGGPVQPEQGLVLFGSELSDSEARAVVDGLQVSASTRTLSRLCEGTGARFHCFSGYAGWGPGQLDSELAESAWLIMPVELDLIFEIPSTSAWEMAIRRLGADPHFLQMGHGIH